MRTEGTVTHWNEDKGYGFITPASGAGQVFVHISAFRDRSERPAIDQRVEYSLSRDQQGRPCAVRVITVGQQTSRKNRRSGRPFYVEAAVVFLAIVGLSVVAGDMPAIVLFLYLGTSLLTFSIYYWDKLAARTGAWRIQESTLHGLALLGGWPGALIAQQLLRHKSRKTSFRAVFRVTVLVNCGAFIWLFTPAGGETLRRVLALA